MSAKVADFLRDLCVFFPVRFESEEQEMEWLRSITRARRASAPPAGATIWGASAASRSPTVTTTARQAAAMVFSIGVGNSLGINKNNKSEEKTAGSVAAKRDARIWPTVSLPGGS